MEDSELYQFFIKIIYEMKKNVDVFENQIITLDNVFQSANRKNREHFKVLIDKLLLPGSDIQGKENICEFYENFRQGKTSLIISEHKSNFDVPLLYALLNRMGKMYQEFFEKIVFIAGRKLNEEHPIVKLFAEQFNRIIVVPKSEVNENDEDDLKHVMKVNFASQRFIKENKQNYIFLVYPTGTRSKPWDRSTYKGLKQIYNYVKRFDQLIYLSTNGNCLVPKDTEMAQERPRKDKVNIIFSKPIQTKDLLEHLKNNWQNDNLGEPSFKQFVIDFIMKEIYEQKGIMPWDEK